MLKFYVLTLLKIRWIYFHLSLAYVKFRINADDTECYFQHKHSGEICCNYSWVDKEEGEQE